MDACICLPDPREVMGPLSGEAARVASGPLHKWLLQERAAAEARGVEPIPAAMRPRLAPYFTADLLDSVRYRVGGSDELGAASTMLQNSDIQAVTLIDIIVFRTPEGAADDVALWAHELVHVQQYREWGVEEFARRYTEDAAAVEEPAYEMQSRVTKALQGK